MPPRMIIDPSMLESAVEERVSRPIDYRALSELISVPRDGEDEDEYERETSSSPSLNDGGPLTADMLVADDEDIRDATEEDWDDVSETIEEQYYTIEDRLDNLNGYMESVVELLPHHLASVPNLEQYRENEIEMNLDLLREAMQNYETFDDDTELNRLLSELADKHKHPTAKLMQMVNTIKDLKTVQTCIMELTSQRSQHISFWQRHLRRLPSTSELDRAQSKLDHYYNEFDETNVLNRTFEDNNWERYDNIQKRIHEWIDDELNKDIRECVVNEGVIQPRRRTGRRTGEGTRKHKKHHKRQTFKTKRKSFSGISRSEFIKLAMQCRVSRKKAQDVWSSFIALGETMIPHQKNYIELLRRNMRNSKCAPHPKRTRRLRNIKKISGITKKKFMDAAMRCHNNKRHAEEIWRAFVILGTNIAPHKRGYTHKIKHLGKKTRCAQKKQTHKKTHKRR
jgi:hypothetical protein